MTKDTQKLLFNVGISLFGTIMTALTSLATYEISSMANSLKQLEKGFAQVNSKLIQQDFRLNWMEKKLNSLESSLEAPTRQ